MSEANKRPYRRKSQEQRKRYVENLVIGGMNKKDAALAAGFSPSMAKSPGNRIETPEVLAAIENLEKALVARIPTTVLVEKFAEGLEATTVRTTSQDGAITDIQKFPDYATRLQYLEKIALISGRYKPKTTTEHTGKNGGPIELAALTHEELEQRKQWLERELGISRRGGPAGGALPSAKGGPEAG